MRRRIFLCMGLSVLLVIWGFCREGQASSAYQVRQGDTLHSKSQPSVNFRERIYQVKKGDSLAKIADETGISIADFCKLNRLKGSTLQIGQRIELYRIPEYESAQTAESVKNQDVAELEPEDVDDEPSGEEASTVGERQKQKDAAPFGHWKNPEEQRMLIKVAMGFLGAPYRFGGNSVTGLDCSAFVKKTYQFFGIDLPRTALQQSLVGLHVKRSKLAAGDLIFFNKKRRLSHVGIYIGDDKFVHASSYKRRVRVDDLNMPYFDKHFVRAVRLKGNDEGSEAVRRNARGG